MADWIDICLKVNEAIKKVDKKYIKFAMDNGWSYKSHSILSKGLNLGLDLFDIAISSKNESLALLLEINPQLSDKFCISKNVYMYDNGFNHWNSFKNISATSLDYLSGNLPSNFLSGNIGLKAQNNEYNIYAVNAIYSLFLPFNIDRLNNFLNSSFWNKVKKEDQINANKFLDELSSRLKLGIYCLNYSEENKIILEKMNKITLSHISNVEFEKSRISNAINTVIGLNAFINDDLNLWLEYSTKKKWLGHDASYLKSASGKSIKEAIDYWNRPIKEFDRVYSTLLEKLCDYKMDLGSKLDNLVINIENSIKEMYIPWRLYSILLEAKKNQTTNKISEYLSNLENTNSVCEINTSSVYFATPRALLEHIENGAVNQSDYFKKQILDKAQKMAQSYMDKARSIGLSQTVIDAMNPDIDLKLSSEQINALQKDEKKIIKRILKNKSFTWSKSFKLNYEACAIMCGFEPKKLEKFVDKARISSGVDECLNALTSSGLITNNIKSNLEQYSLENLNTCNNKKTSNKIKFI